MKTSKTFAFLCVCVLVLIAGAFLLKEPQKKITDLNFQKIVASPVSYQSTTADECIHEKECVWDAFSKLLLGSSGKREGWVLKRWEKPVVIQLLDGEPYKDEVLKVVKEINPYFPHKIHINKDKTNSFFLFADSLEQAFFQKYYSFFENIYVTKMYLIENALKRNLRLGCYTNRLHNKNKEIISGILMAETGQISLEKCIVSSLYSIVSNSTYLNLPFDFQKNPNITGRKITKVDLLLLVILYHQNFKTGMSFEEVQSNFDDVYLNAKKYFLTINEKN